MMTEDWDDVEEVCWRMGQFQSPEWEAELCRAMVREMKEENQELT